MKKQLFTLALATSLLDAYSQQTVVQGMVSNKQTGEALAGVTITANGSTTYSGKDGRFSLTVKTLPAKLQLSSAEFEALELEAATADMGLVSLYPKQITQQEVVVTGSTRIPTRLINAPVSIEQYNHRQIAHAPTDYYSLAAYRKGIDITTSSMTFKTISTRGFNGSGSARVNQLVDGMDNQAPGLNFFVGNFAGLTELDVDHVEVLPGASSALYGPGGMNGTVLINSKNPFQHQGLSVQLRQGVNHVDSRQRPGPAPVYDYSVRYAKAFNDKLAIKLAAQYLEADDWLAGDTANYLRTGSVGKLIAGTRATDPNYDGVNVYGDETSVNIRNVAKIMSDSGLLPAAALAFIPNTNVSRTGYQERELIDPKTKNIKVTGALHYRITPKLEARLAGNWSGGNTVYTGNNRYALKDIRINQYKAELVHKNWFLRAFTTQEDAGEAYTATVSAQRLNEAWLKSQIWYPVYVGAYATGAGSIFAQERQNGKTPEQAMQTVMAATNQLHQAARQEADKNRPVAGSATFNQLFDQVRKTPLPDGGLFVEKSQLWMYEGQYSFNNLLRFADVVVGANFKKYNLNSRGTLFIDSTAPIKINEAGAYAQVSKKLFKEVLALSFSGRYDKNEDFKGRFTPRATALVKVATGHTFRLSYQTAYRFATTQQKFIRLDVGDYTILGGLPWINQYMNLDKFPAVDITTGKPYSYSELKPESMRSVEAGYRALIGKKLYIDAYAYLGKYTDFLGRKTLFQPGTGKIYSVVINSSTEVNTHGFGISFDYRLPRNFAVFANGYSDQITDVPSGFQAFFNTPKYRFNAGITNTGLGKKERVGFSLLYRWQDAFRWDGELANGPLGAFSTLDAQVSYRFPKVKTIIKVGGTNVLNHYYQNAYGNPAIGGMYYFTLGYNIL